MTPPHTDPHHNLLAQVVGRKYVRLWAPAVAPGLYPFPAGFTTNASQVIRAPHYVSPAATLWPCSNVHLLHRY